MSDRSRAVGLHPSLAGMSSHWATLGKYEEDFAREKRARGWGWQAIARALSVNEIDLRRHCGCATVGPAPTKPVATEARAADPVGGMSPPSASRAPDMRPILRDGPTYQVLKILIETPATVAAISAILARPEHGVMTVLGKLVGRRLAVRRGDAEVWGATPAGMKVFEAARDACRPTNAALSQIERVLLAIVDGDRTSAEVARRLSITVANASGALHALTNTGHLRSKPQTAKSNLWVPTVKGRERADRIRADRGGPGDV